jgi:hypothetical protein
MKIVGSRARRRRSRTGVVGRLSAGEIEDFPSYTSAS